MIREYAPDIFGWGSETFGLFESGYAVIDDLGTLLIDPSPAGLDNDADWLRSLPAPAAILLTCAANERAAATWSERLGIPVFARPEAAAQCKRTRPMPFPATLPWGVEIVAIEGGAPGEVAIYVPRDGGTLITGLAWTCREAERFNVVIQVIHALFDKGGDLRFHARDRQVFQAAQRQLLERPLERLLPTYLGYGVGGDAGQRMRACLDGTPGARKVPSEARLKGAVKYGPWPLARAPALAPAWPQARPGESVALDPPQTPLPPRPFGLLGLAVVGCGGAYVASRLAAPLGLAVQWLVVLAYARLITWYWFRWGPWGER